MVSNVQKATTQRRSRSRTPSRVATPQVSKVKPPEKKQRKRKTPSKIVTSTPKHAKSSKKMTPGSSRKRKTIVLNDDNEFDEMDYDVEFSKPKKIKSPNKKSTKGSSKSKSSSTSKANKSTHESDDETMATRRSRRIRDQILHSINEESESSKTNLDRSKSASVNGSIDRSRNRSLNTTESANSWNWFNCAIM